jgi:phospholipid transport system substrate-binding protein
MVLARIPGLLLAACLLLSAVTVQAAATPTDRVRDTVDRILAVIGDTSMDWQERHRRISAIVDSTFDFRSMSQSVLATNWKRASPAEREQFVEFFSDYLENTYMEKIDGHRNARVEYSDESIKGNRAVVDTMIVEGGKRIPVSYRMHQSDDRWYTYDVVIEGVSLVANYRDVYLGVIQRQGLTGLLNQLEQKIRDQKRRQGQTSG